MPVLEILVLQVLIVGCWVVLTQGRRLRRLERATARSPVSKQMRELRDGVWALHDHLTELSESHDDDLAAQRLHLVQVDAAIVGLRTDLRALARRLERLPGAMASLK